METSDPRPSHGRARLIIVEDEAYVRRGLTLRLGTEPDLEVVATTADADHALHLARDLTPDVVLLDTRFPGTTGPDLIRRLTAELPGIAVVVLSLSEDRRSRDAALAAGARHFISMHDGDQALLAAIRDPSGPR